MQMHEGREDTGVLAPKSQMKVSKRAHCCLEGVPRSEHLDKVVQTLDYCSEKGGEDVQTLWHSKQERSSWLQELHDAQTLISVAYLLRCLQFALQPHL